ncbi:hypothetical protein SSBR45G_08510 [Bradyrhizobium sp. SSBR45G]|nr:hypothetical protein SSBR45G_08510 [Bradyrhizobium sp. SSBR45G]GLH85180.1 hypothetical protein SSBR45R_26400 [Bradyrhizobium sp. SSBR45R]
MPQTPKLTIKTPMTTAMMVLPSQFDEALRNPRSMGPICLQEKDEEGRALKQIPRKGVTELKRLIKRQSPGRNLGPEAD